jgi:hypothetical protein
MATFKQAHKKQYANSLMKNAMDIAVEMQYKKLYPEEVAKLLAINMASVMAKTYAELQSQKLDNPQYAIVSAELFVFFKDIQKILLNLKETDIDE